MALRITCVFFIALAVFIFGMALTSSGIAFWLKSILSILTFLLALGGLLGKYEITEHGPRALIGPFVRSRSKQIHWDDIEEIYDDNLSSSHFYMFKLRNKSYWKSYGCHNSISNYRDFLRESILRVRPDTRVDPKILSLIGFIPSDIGKRYKATESSSKS